MKVLLRFVWFWVRLLLVALVVVTLSLAAYTHGMNQSFIRILVQSGLDMRASVLFGLSGPNELDKYFTISCLSEDPIWQDNPYMPYDVTSFDSELLIEKISSWPWQETAEVKVLHDVTRIDGYKRLSAQTPEELKNPDKIPAPDWKGGEYKISLVKREQSWLIARIEKVQEMDLPPRFTAEPAQETLPPTAPLSPSVLPSSSPSPATTTP